MNENKEFPLRRVRSFVCRDGRMTEAQRSAYQELWPVFGLTKEDGLCDFDKIFKREAPRVLEIGFGSGESFLAMAKENPNQDFMGIEMHLPGIGTVLNEVGLQQLRNIRIFYEDAVEVLEQCIPNASVDVVQIFFPDPWPKRRHHKRRLIQAAFLNLVICKLKAGGTIHLATDWEHYALEMMTLLSDLEGLINIAGAGCFSNRSTQRPVITKFERRGNNEGRRIWEMQFVKP